MAACSPASPLALLLAPSSLTLSSFAPPFSPSQHGFGLGPSQGARCPDLSHQLSPRRLLWAFHQPLIPGSRFWSTQPLSAYCVLLKIKKSNLWTCTLSESISSTPAEPLPSSDHLPTELSQLPLSFLLETLWNALCSLTRSFFGYFCDILNTKNQFLVGRSLFKISHSISWPSKLWWEKYYCYSPTF